MSDSYDTDQVALDALRSEVERLQEERDRFRGDLGVTRLERDTAKFEIERLEARCQSWAEDYGSAAGQRDRYGAALRRIVKGADECPTEDMLSAGEIAREALGT